MIAINNEKLKEVIGIGSLSGWTREHCHEELKSIQSAAAEGGLSLEEWDKMDDALTCLVMCVSCESFSTLVRLYFTGRYGDQKFNDVENWF